MILMGRMDVLLEMLIYLTGLEELGLLPQVILQPSDSHHPPMFDDLCGLETQVKSSHMYLYSTFHTSVKSKCLNMRTK